MNPASIGEVEGITLGVKQVSNNNEIPLYHLVVPVLSHVNLGYQLLPGILENDCYYYNQWGSGSMNCDETILSPIFTAAGKMSLFSSGYDNVVWGLNYKIDRVYDVGMVDPGLVYHFPKHEQAGQWSLGFYTTGLWGGYEGQPVIADIQGRWTSAGGLLAAHTTFNLFGDPREPDRQLKYLYKCKKLAAELHPIPWLSLSYIKYMQFVDEYQMAFDWKPRGWISHLKIKLSGLRETRGGYVNLAGGMEMGLFGNHLFRNKGPASSYDKYREKHTSAENDSGLDRETWAKNYRQYRKEKIGFFRGRFWPYLNTFGYFTTILIPAGTSSLAVGNYKPGLVLLGANTAFFAYMVSTSWENDDPMLYYIWGMCALKVTDFIFSQRHVNRYNRGLKEKYQLTAYPVNGGLGAVAQVRF